MSSIVTACKQLTIYDIADTTFQRMILFLVYDEPSELLKIRALSKHFYNILDINNGGTNYIWKVICNNRFQNISSNFQTKRWDKLYQLRVMAMQRDFKYYSTNYVNVNKITDIEDIVIEGCKFGLPISYKLDKPATQSIYTVLKEFTFEEIKIKNSLYENGEIWFIKCPIFSATQSQTNHFVHQTSKDIVDDIINELINNAIRHSPPPRGRYLKPKKIEIDAIDAHSRQLKLETLQRDLFGLTVTTVFRKLEEEGIWQLNNINDDVRERFNAETMYEIALREDIPWRVWSIWARDKITTYLRENNLLLPPNYQQIQQQQPVGPQMYPFPATNYPQQPMHASCQQLQTKQQKQITFCDICKKNIYLVETEKEMEAYLDNGSCVTLSGKLIPNCGVM